MSTAAEGFARGFGQARQEMERQRAGRGVFGWALEPKERGRFCFLEGEPITRKRHFLQIGGQGWMDLTCIEDRANGVECPFCNVDDFEVVSMLTVLDLRPWKDPKNGNRERAVSKRALTITKQSLEIFEGYHQKKKGLFGWIVEAVRTGQKSPRIGDNFDFEERVDPLERWGDADTLWFLPTGMTPEQYLAPINFEEAYQRASPEEAERMARRVRNRGASKRGSVTKGAGGGSQSAGPQDAPPPSDDDMPPGVR